MGTLTVRDPVAEGPPCRFGKAGALNRQWCSRCRGGIAVFGKVTRTGQWAGTCSCPRDELIWEADSLAMRWRARQTQKGMRRQVEREAEAARKSWEFAARDWGR